MSLILKHNESPYESLLKYFAVLSRESLNVFEFIAATALIIVVSYILYLIHDYYRKRFRNELKYNLLELQKFKHYNRLLIRHKSIISHKEMLKALEYAADNCYKTTYALKCIDIVAHCPQLVNAKSPPCGLTPFHRVCYRGHKALIIFMLAKGADPSLTTINGDNALCLAIYYFLNKPMEHDFSCLDILARTVSSRKMKTWNLTFFHLPFIDTSCKVNNAILCFYVGCGIGSEDKWYNYILEMALVRNHTKLLQWLILHHTVSTQFFYKTMRCSSVPLL
ncbi:unnamed protein product [Xylocopa violacea]|uniref:Uncharacterized protein n=1 Tax=Xylocopa violacea TaxID=135666 RepID=A0ABP1N6F5_XYLVO